MNSDQTSPLLMDPGRLGGLLLALVRKGYQALGPVRSGGSLAYGPVSGPDDLAAGWRDEQTPGSYRLGQSDDGLIFSGLLGADSVKRLFYPPELNLFEADREDGGWRIQPPAETGTPLAVIGLRPCELAALNTLDHVFSQGPFADAHYQARRKSAFLVVVNCGRSGGNCFCASTNSGPFAKSGHDLALTEVNEDGEHFFLVQAGSDAGAGLCAELGLAPAGGRAAWLEKYEARAINGQTISFDAAKTAEGLLANLDHPAWDSLAQNCLGCGNCTMVCPTCFCATVQDTQDLSGIHAARLRRWDSCFTQEHSYIHGGNIRPSPAARYRQWLTHKLATLKAQYGAPGCVGCGRCITWCPVGLDLIALARKFLASGGDSPPVGRG